MADTGGLSPMTAMTYQKMPSAPLDIGVSWSLSCRLKAWSLFAEDWILGGKVLTIGI